MNRSLRFTSIFLIVAGFVLGLANADAQTIQRRISYQGLLTQTDGTPITDGTYGLVLRLYDAPTGGNLVYEEVQQVTTVKGLFNALIGSQVSLASVNFNQQLWLETAITGQQAFSPRTLMAVVPYAIRAESATVADSLGDDVTGVVRSLNGGQGDLTIVGLDGISVSREGDTIRISGSLSGGSIEEITSQDGTIDVSNPNGPIVDLGLADGAVTEDKIADGAVTNTKISNNAVNSTKIENGSVRLEDLEPGIIPTTLPPSGPAGGDLVGTYPNPLIRPDAVTSDKILDGQVKTQDLEDGSVTNQKISNNAVTEPKLANGSVSNSKLADNSVSTSKVIDESITTAKLSKTGVVPGIYGSSLLVPRFEVDDRGRITNVSQVSIPDIPFTGPAGGDLTGTYPNPTIKPGVVDNVKLANNSVTGNKIVDGTVTTADIADGTITTADIAPGVIPTTLPPSGPAGGVLSGNYPNPNINGAQGQQLLNALNASATGTINDALLNPSGVAAGTYGNGPGGLVPRVTVDQYGRVTAAVEQQILSATPTGPAGGDLQGTYPNPTLNPTAAAGGRMVDAIRADFLGGDADINSPNNVVVLDGSNRFPAANGSLITNINAGNITAGVLPIERGGTNSSTSLQNNRIMISSGGKIVESAPVAAQQILIGSGLSTLPTPGTITAGPGINVSFASPNFVISNTNAKLLPGTANDQTLRWDATFNQWVPNNMLLATAAGDVNAKGNVLIEGTLTAWESTNIGTMDNTVNNVGPGANTTNTIGSPTATNYINGTTFINGTTSTNTSIGNLSASTSSTTINVGSAGNLQLNGIDDEVPFRFLAMNNGNNVRSALASGLALEGIMWQNGAFRLGGTNGTINPLLQDRYININNNSLYFTRLGGAGNMIQINGGSNTLTVEATTNINTVGTTLTTIGNPGSRTTIGGQLDPRGDITNDVGDVVIRDQTQIIGATFINSGTNFNTTIGQQAGTGDQSISLSVGTGANGYLFAHNIKPDPLPLYMMTQDGFERVRKKLLADMADEGIQYQNGAFRLGAGASTPNFLREKSYDEDRYVNLDMFAINYTDGSEGADGTMFVQFDGNNGGAPLVTVTSETDINIVGAGNTNIGNAASTTTVLGPTFVNALGTSATQIGNGIGANGNVGIGEPAVLTHLLSINGTPQTNAAMTPNVLVDHLGGDAFNAAPYIDDAQNGVITSNGTGELFKWDEFVFLDPFAWRTIGNSHPIIDGTNNLMGTLDNGDNVHFVTDFNNAGNYVMTMSGADQTLGIGTNGPGSGIYQVEIENLTAANGLSVTANGPGAVGISSYAPGPASVGMASDATDIGLVVGVNVPPINGIEVNALGVGLMMPNGGPAPAVGISIDQSPNGLQITNATTAILAEGDNLLNFGGAGNTGIGIGLAPDTRVNVNNVINVTGNAYNINGRPVYRINGNNFLWEGAGGTANTLVGNTGNTALAGNNNTIVGNGAFSGPSTGSNNTIIGAGTAAGGNKTDLVAVGADAALNPGGNVRAVVIGTRAAQNATGGENTIVGHEAGLIAAGANVLIGNNAGTVVGLNNVIIGHRAGMVATGAGNVFIGKSVGETNFAGAVSNTLLIDNADVANPLIQGNFASDVLTLNVASTNAAFTVTGAPASENTRIASLAPGAHAPFNPINDGLVIADAQGDLRRYDPAADQGVSLANEAGLTRWRLGGLANTDVPFLANRFVNINANNLTFTANGGANNLVGLTGGANGAVAIESYGTGLVNINVAGNEETQIGNGIGANGNVGIGEPGTGTHLLTINGTAQTAAVAVPNVRVRHLGGDAITNAYPNIVPTNGIVTADGDGDLIKWDENTLIGTFAWLRIGNVVADGNNHLGTNNPVDLNIRTNGVTHLTFSAAGAITQAPTAGNVTFTGVVDAQNQGNTIGNNTANRQLTIDGVNDAVVGNTIAGNPTVWDAVVDGDLGVAGLMKVGGSVWIDGTSATHALAANAPLNILTLTADNLTLSTNNINALVVNGATQNVNILNDLDVDGDLNADGITTLDETTIDGTLDQTGGGQITLSGNVDANNGVDVFGANLNVDAAVSLQGPGSGHSLGTAATDATVLSILGDPNNVGNYELFVDGDVQITGLLNLPGLSANSVVVTDATGNLITDAPAFTYDAATDVLDIRGTIINGAGDVTVNDNLDVNDNLVVEDFTTLGDADTDVHTIRGATNINTAGTAATTIGSATAGAFTVTSGGAVTLTSGGAAEVQLISPNDIRLQAGDDIRMEPADDFSVRGANVDIQLNDQAANAGTVTIGNTTNGGAVNILAEADITINPSAGDNVVLQNIAAANPLDDVVMINGSNQVRRFSGTPGVSVATLNANATRTAPAAVSTVPGLTISIPVTGTYEVEVVVFYHTTADNFGAAEVGLMNWDLTGAAGLTVSSISYGMGGTSGGYGVEPGAAFALGTDIIDLGCPINPSVPATATMKGMMVVTATGDISFAFGTGLGMTPARDIVVRAGSYIKVSRVQ